MLASGAVLVLEVLSQRLIAPYVGLTLQTSTSVIGIALAAIAVGAWLGGTTADRLPPAQLLGPLLLAGGALVFAVSPLVRFVGALVHGGDPSGVLVIAAAAMFAPAALLSAVTPVVIRARLANLRETGAVVGRLSGLGTLGSIVATFGTGFVLVAWVPTTVILTCLGALLVAAGVLVVLVAKVVPTKRASAGLLALALVGLGATAAAPNPCDVETAYHCASVTTDPARPNGRVLRLDTLQHSYVDLADPTFLQFAYVKVIAAAVDAFRPTGRPVRALHLGGGGLTLPRYLAATRPGSSSLVYEIDPGVLALDRSELGRLDPKIATTVEDARLGVADQPENRFDLVVGDAFGGVAVPWHLTTREAVTGVDRTLVPDGLYAVNLIDHGPLAFARAEVATIAERFPQVALIAQPAALTDQGGNLVVLASRSSLPLTALTGRLAAYRVLTGQALTKFIRKAQILTDDFAPVDQMLTPYR